MKKLIITLAIATIFCLIFAACGNNTEATTTTELSTTQLATEEIDTDFIEEDLFFEEESNYIIDYLQDYHSTLYDANNEWMLDEKTKYSYGKFYYEDTEIFDTSTLSEDIVPEDVRLLGCSISSNGTKYIGCKYLNNIWLLVESNQEFTARLIADDAVDYWEEMIYPNRTDCYAFFYNEDAVQYERTIIYRSIYGGLKQVNLLDTFISSTPINYTNPILIYDYSGVFWLTYENFENPDNLTEIIEIARHISNHPYTYINKAGQSTNYILCQ